MTLLELQHLLSRIKYKPNTSFMALCKDDLKPPVIELMITQRLPNVKACAPSQKVQVNMIKRFTFVELKRYGTVKMIGTIYKMLQDMELHEVAEWFKLDGLNFVEPHPDTTPALAAFKAKMWSVLSKRRSG